MFRISLWNIFKIIFCLWVYVYEYTHLCTCEQRPEEGIKSTGAGATGGCELTILFAGNWSWVLSKSSVFLTSEPSLQPWFYLLRQELIMCSRLAFSSSPSPYLSLPSSRTCVTMTYCVLLFFLWGKSLDSTSSSCLDASLGSLKVSRWFFSVHVTVSLWVSLGYLFCLLCTLDLDLWAA